MYSPINNNFSQIRNVFTIMAYHLFASFKLHHDLDYRKQDCARYAFFFISIVLFTAIQF